MTHPRTLDELPPPNEATARRLMFLLFRPPPLTLEQIEDHNSEPLEVDLP